MDTQDTSNQPKMAKGGSSMKLVGAIMVIIIIVGVAIVFMGFGHNSSAPINTNTSVAKTTTNKVNSTANTTSTKNNKQTTTTTNNKTITSTPNNVSAAPSSNKFSNASIISAAQFDSVLGGKWTYLNTTNGSIGSGNNSVIYYTHYVKYNKTTIGTVGIYSSQNATKILDIYYLFANYTLNKSDSVNGTINGIKYTYGDVFNTVFSNSGNVISVSRNNTGIVALDKSYFVFMLIHNYTSNLTDAKELLQYQLNDMNTSS